MKQIVVWLVPVAGALIGYGIATCSENSIVGGTTIGLGVGLTAMVMCLTAPEADGGSD